HTQRTQYRALRAGAGRPPCGSPLVGPPGRVPAARPRPSKPHACGILETCSSDLRTRSQIGELLPPLRRKDRMIRSCPKPPACAGSNFENHLFTLLEHIRGPEGDTSAVSSQ